MSNPSPRSINVVPLARGRGDRFGQREAPEISLTAGDRPVRQAGPARWAWWSALVLLSLIAHAGAYFLLQREPQPLSSIGLETISVDIVLGSDTAAVLASRPEHSDAPAPAQSPEAMTERARNEPEIADEEPPSPEPEVGRMEQSNVEPLAPASADEPVLLTPQTPLDAPASATIVKPEPRSAEAAMPEAKQPEPKRLTPAQTAGDRKRVTEPEQPRRAVRQAAVRRASNEPQSTSPAATAASGVGRGRSDSDTNYRALVAAHLARYKQFPAVARNRGHQGSAVVAFSLSGSGSVTSARLVSATGVESLDYEATAMVRRASPFPAPPDGRAVSFTVPVSFRIR